MLQSALRTGSPQAEALAGLWWVYFGVLVLVFVVVMALLAGAVTGPRRNTPGEALVAVGVAITVVVLLALLVVSAVTGETVSAASRQAPMRVAVAGEQWWWEVRYPGTGAVLANEIRLPAGRPAEIAVSSDNVIHSFWVPGLAGKVDMVPGHPNVLALQPARPGLYRGQCAEFCGVQHGLMAFMVVVMPPAEFEDWLERQARPAPPPATAAQARGRALFLSSGCGDCHTVRGTPADGRTGPDLTHVGSRLTLGAASLPRNVGTLAGWIANSHAIKPGNLMPAFDHFRGEDLRALAQWLEGLE